MIPARCPLPTGRRRMGGVTLTELMIVAVVLGILAAVALPNYQHLTQKARRNEAKAALLQVATNEERFYLDNNTYTSDMTKLGFPSSPFTTKSGAYLVAVTSADASGYRAEAGYQLTDSEGNRCNIFTIDGTGTKRSSPLTDCWARTR